MDTSEFEKLTGGVKEAQEKAREAVKIAAMPAATALFKAFFAAHPEVKAVAWRQDSNCYDDETYSYRISDPRVRLGEPLNWSEVDGPYAEDDDGNELFVDRHDDQVDGALEDDLRSLHRHMDEDLFRAAFGDDATVIVTPETFHVLER